MTKSVRRILFLILLLALMLRVGLVIAQPATPAWIDRLPDQREYLSLARHLLHSHTLYFVDPRFGQAVYAYRMPGYPVFLACCGGSVLLGRLGQCLLDVSSVLAVFLTASRLTSSDKVGLIAAGFIACNPFYIYFSNLLLSETLFATLSLWSIFFLMQRSVVKILIGSLLLILAAYAKTTGLLLFPALVFACMLNSHRPAAYRLSDLRRVCLSSMPFLLLLLAMTPWAWRNNQLLGHWIWTTTNSGVTLYDGFNAHATGASDQRFVTLLPGLMSMNEVQRSNFLAGAAGNWAMAHWARIPALSAVKILRGWSPVPLSADYGKPVYRLISAVYAVPFDLLCLVGLFSPRLNRRAKLLIVMPALVVTLGQVLSVGSLRYRMPAEAPLAIVAAVGAMDVLRALKFQR